MWEALALGIIQGLTEFLPISSSAHLTLVPQMMGWTSPLLNSLAFDVALHFGTLLALVLFFWRDILKMTAAFTSGLLQGRPFQQPEARLAWLIVLGTIPAVTMALAMGDRLETMGRQPVWVAAWLIVFGLLMALVERFALHQKTLAEMNPWEALVVGAGQALALFPGVSRSGATITAGMGLRFERAAAARFSFLLSLPAVLAAVVHEGRAMLAMAMDQNWGVLVVGITASALTGYACIQWLLSYLRHRPLYPFAIYRLLLGAGVLWWAWRG